MRPVMHTRMQQGHRRACTCKACIAAIAKHTSIGTCPQAIQNLSLQRHDNMLQNLYGLVRERQHRALASSSSSPPFFFFFAGSFFGLLLEGPPSACAAIMSGRCPCLMKLACSPLPPGK